MEAKGDYHAIYVDSNLTISKTTGFSGEMTAKSANSNAIDIYGNLTIDGVDVTVTTSNDYCVGVSGNLTLNSGSLAMTCTYTGTSYAYNALVVNKDLIVNGGSLKATAPANKGGAVVVKGNATFKGGTHTITSATGNAIELPNGYMSVQGGDLTVSGGENGIKLTTGRLNMNGGFLIIKSTNTASDSSYSALKVAGTDSNYYNVASSLGQAASTGNGKSGLKKVAGADLSTYDYIQIGDFVEIGGTTVRSGYSITASGTVSSGNYGTGSIYYSNGVLTINQFNFVTDTHRGIEAYKDVTMKVTGDSSIVVTGSYYGVVIYGNVTLSGTEKLTSSSNSNGMCVYGSMTVSGPEVVVNGNNNAVSGLYITGNLTVNSGMVTGDSGKDNGIYVLGNMTVTGGEVYAEGGLNGVRVNGKFTLTGGILKALSFDTTNDSSYAALKLAGTSGSYYSVSSSLMQMASSASNANTLSELVITKLGDYDYVIIGDGIFVGDVLVPTGYYLVQGATKPVTSTSANNYVYYNNGTLKVNNFTFDGEHFIRTSGDLTLNVYGTNSATCYSNHIIVDGDLTVNGTGRLHMETDKSFAVLVCGGNMTLSNATVTIKSTGPIGAIRLDHNGDYCGDGNLTINSGKLTVEALSSHSNNKTIIARDVNIKGGTVRVTSGYVPFWNGGIMNISGGTVTIAGDVCGVTWAYNAYEKVMNITGGNVLITSTDVAIDDYNITLNVSGGELSVTGTEKAIYVDECNITGGTVIAKSTGTNSIAIDTDVFNIADGFVAMGSNYLDGSDLHAVTSGNLSKCKYVKVSACNHLDVTTDKDHKCDICGLDGVTIHEYDHTEHDNTYHYAVCNCGERYITEEHSYVNDKCSCGKNAPAFGIQPAGGEVMAGEEFTVRWTLNFTATKSEVHYVTNRGGTVFVKTISGSATSTTLPARAENYIIVAYYNDTQYVVSGLFKISEKIVTHSVTFDNGGVITTQSVNNGQTIVKPVDPVVEGKNFLGWYTEAGDLFEFSTPITGDIKLIAKFADVIQKFDIDVARMILGNALEFQFGVAQTKIPVKDGFYAVIEKTWADGTTTTKTIPAAEWGTAGQYWAIVYDGLAAKEMGDTFFVTIYNAKGVAVSNAKQDAVRDYVERAYKSQSATGKTMMVDMLNYGAAAQIHFNYGTSDLANNKLTDAQKATGTAAAPEMSNDQVKGTNYSGTRFILESRIQVQLAFKNMTSDMYAIYTYTDAAGKPQTVRVEGTDFVIIGGKPAGVELSALVYADARALVEVTLYNADGTVHGTATDSIESCALRSGGDVFVALMKFADSAREHLY